MQCSQCPTASETCGPHTLEVPRLDSNKSEGQKRHSKVLCWVERRKWQWVTLQGRLWMLDSDRRALFKTLPEWTVIALASVFCLIFFSYLKRPISLLSKYFIMKYSDIQNIYNSIICGHLVTIVFKKGLPGGDSDK